MKPLNVDVPQVSVIQWAPPLQKDWSLNKMKFLLARPITDGPHETPDFIEEGIPFLSVDSIQDGKLVFDDCRYISEEDHIRYKSKCKPQRNDVFMGKAASIGKIAIVDVDFEFSIWSPLALLRPDLKKILPKFFEYTLKSDYCQDQIELYATSNTQKNISMDDIPRIQVITPPLKVQKEVVQFLDNKAINIDETISEDKKLIELLKEKRITLINQAVTRGLDPKVKMKNSNLDLVSEIPEGWDATRLKFLVSKINSGSTPSGGASVYEDEGIPFLRSQNIHFDGLRLDDVAFITKEIHMGMSNSEVKNHDVLLNITGASIGRCYFVEEQFRRANVNQHVCIIRSRSVFYKYLNYYLMSRFGQDQVFSVQAGSSREGLNFEQIGNFIIIHPQFQEQKRIVEFLDRATSNIDTTIQKVEKKIQFLQEYKQSLIHHAVTGKIDVRGVEV